MSKAALILTKRFLQGTVEKFWLKAEHIGTGLNLGAAMMPSLLGMVCAFIAGLLALKWLSKWLESDRWYLFGIYCLAAAVAVAVLSHMGY